MSEASEKARQILTSSADRPHDYELRVAQTYAMVAAAEAIEHLYGTMQNILDRGGLR